MKSGWRVHCIAAAVAIDNAPFCKQKTASKLEERFVITNFRRRFRPYRTIGNLSRSSSAPATVAGGGVKAQSLTAGPRGRGTSPHLSAMPGSVPCGQRQVHQESITHSNRDDEVIVPSSSGPYPRQYLAGNEMDDVFAQSEYLRGALPKQRLLPRCARLIAKRRSSGPLWFVQR